MIFEKVGTHPDDQVLFYGSGKLENDRTLEQYKINYDDVINLITKSNKMVERGSQ